MVRDKNFVTGVKDDDDDSDNGFVEHRERKTCDRGQNECDMQLRRHVIEKS